MGKRVYPYIPNSVPEVQEEMLKYIGAGSIEDLIADIPEEVRMKKPMELPEPYEDEAGLYRHVNGILNKNVTAEELRCFLGAGCYDHYVPAVVDEVINRSEFLTAYAGEPYEDHGRFQALFEYQSMMAELLDFDVCNVPNYDGSQACGTALRMATRITKRKEVLIPRNLNPDVLRVVETYLQPDVKIINVDYNAKTGRICLDSLKAKLTDKAAAVLVMNPFLWDHRGKGRGDSGYGAQGRSTDGRSVDPQRSACSRRRAYRADIACGDIQPLGIHMNYGGGVAGLVATSEKPEIVRNILRGCSGSHRRARASGVSAMSFGAYLLCKQGLRQEGVCTRSTLGHSSRRLSCLNGASGYEGTWRGRTAAPDLPEKSS